MFLVLDFKRKLLGSLVLEFVSFGCDEEAFCSRQPGPSAVSQKVLPYTTGFAKMRSCTQNPFLCL